MLQVSRWKLMITRLTFFSSVLLVYVASLCAVFRGMAQDALDAEGVVDLLALLWRYDETPLRVLCIDQIDALSLPPAFRRTAGAVLHFQQWLKKHAFDAAPTKLLQTEIIVLMMVTVGTMSWSLSARPPVPIQIMSRTTTEVFYGHLFP